MTSWLALMRKKKKRGKVSVKAKPGYQSTTLYQHESTLRFSLSALGVTTFPNHAATAPEMGEFFTP